MLKQIFYISVIVALLFLTSCQIKPSGTVDIYNPFSIEDCRSLEESEEYSDIPLITDKMICLANYGKIAGNYSECNGEEEPFCMGGFAVNLNNATICDDESCFLAIGLTSDVELCENIAYEEKSARYIDFEEEARNICKLGAAVAKKDISICKKFEEESYLKYYCSINVAKQTKNKNICESLEERVAEECFFIVAIEKNDKSLCKKALERRQECEDIIVNKRAKKELNPFKCYQLEDYYEAAACITAIATEKSDIKLCDNLEAGFGQVRKECYEEVAMNNDEISFCEKLLDYPSANECYKKILDKNRHSIKLCEALEDTSLLYCARNIDCEKSNEKARCFEFSQNVLKNNELFITPNNESVCIEITGRSVQKEQCFYNLAIDKKDLRLCGLSGSLTDRCSKNVLLVAIEKDKNRIRDTLKKRINSSFNVGFSGSDGTVFAVKNNGKFDLDPSKFMLFREFKLMTLDGCKEKSSRKAKIGDVPLEDRKCSLIHNSYPVALFEVTYNGITVFVK